MGTDDKRQIAAALTVTASGEMLLAQMIYGGKTPASLPKVDFPEGWHLTGVALALSAGAPLTAL